VLYRGEASDLRGLFLIRSERKRRTRNRSLLEGCSVHRSSGSRQISKQASAWNIRIVRSVSRGVWAAYDMIGPRKTFQGASAWSLRLNLTQHGETHQVNSVTFLGLGNVTIYNGPPVSLAKVVRRLLVQGTATSKGLSILW